MAGQTFEEVLRIVLETQGEEGLAALRAAMSEVGDVSDATVADTGKLIDRLAELNAQAGKAARFGQMADDFARTSEAMDSAQNATYQLTLRMGELSSRGEALAADHKAARAEVDRLSAAMKQEGADADALGKAHKAAQAEVKRLGAELRDNGKEIKATATAQQAARAEMEKLEGVYGKQAAALDKLDKELADSGRNTKDLGKLQGTLAAEIADATGDIQKQAAAMQAEAKAAAALRQRLDEGDEAFRKFAQAGTASAEALQRYRAGADAAATSSGRLEASGGRLASIFSGLRGLIAPVLAYLSFDAAKQGITNLLGVGSAAENARRSLRNLYGGVEAGNAAYAGLRDMAAKNGIAFNDLVETAKKLKAFGLDPLNGSLQALIDQNAAVGGSMQDLDGKVLALGQAWAKQKLQGEEILQLVERGVPVWDLLQKATGKNVDELQKLSSAGKLGRDVIAGLYQQIGQENAGAAAAALFSLSGGIQQLAARWTDFLQRVAESGVTEYFKKQIDALLGGTASLDSLAKRVADAIIGSIEALRRFGEQLVVVLKPVADLTLWLGKNAEAVFLLVKAYAALKLAEVAQGFFLVTSRAQAAAAATTAAGVAAGGAGGMFGKLGAAIALIPRLIRMSVVVAGAEAALYFWEQAAVEIQKVQEAEAHANLLRMNAASLQRDQIALGEKLQAIYKTYAGTAIESANSLRAMTREQASDYAFALGQAQRYYEGVIREARAAGDAQGEATARERWNALGEAIKAAEGQLEALKKAADPRGLQAFVDTAVSKFDELVTKSKDANKAVSGIFDGIDFRQADGIAQAGDILTQLAARGKDAGAAIKTELSEALSKVAVQDLPAVKAQAEAAMAAGVTGAKQFADAVASVNLQRLGVDIDAIKTGFTAAGRSAVDAFRGAVDEVDKLGLTVEQRSRAIAQAFDSAFRQASTKAELQALKAALQDALSAGDIGFAEFQQRVAEADAKLSEVGGTGKKMGADVASGASQAASALSSMSSSADSATTNMRAVAKETEKTGEAGKRARPNLESVSLGLRGINENATKALLGLNKLQLAYGRMTSGGFGHIWADAVNDLTKEMRDQLQQLEDNIAALEKQAEQYDENAQRLADLRQQYKWLTDDELQRLIDAENNLKEGRDRAAEDAKRQAEETAAAYEEQRKAAEAAGASLTGRADQTPQQTAAIADQVISSAVAATQAMSKVAASAELTLRVISEPVDGLRIQLTQQQMYEIASACVRLINQSKSVST